VVLAWLAARAVPGIEKVEDGVYTRTAVRGGRPGVVTINTAARRLERRARLVLGRDQDTDRIDAALGADPLLGPLVEARPGLRVAGAWDGFELAVRAVLGQQVSVAAGRGLAERLARRHGEPLPRPAGGLERLFPSPERLAAAEIAGMPATRARALQALAVAVAPGGLVIDERQDLETVRGALLELPGIGPWTVEYVAMRALRDPDAFPASDLVLRNRLGGISARELHARAEAWRPWRAYAAMHLWTAGVPLNP
jgi:AraC family transcriptional regulator, regulatory protein of adaptative response / DNA-3-methyladenine glycosylase II